MKKLRWFLLILFVFLFTFAFEANKTSQFSLAPKEIHAQTITIPSPYCLGSCPTGIPSVNPTITGTTPTFMASPTAQTSPVPTASSSPTPSITPCDVNQTSIQHSGKKKKHKKKSHGGNDRGGGFLEACIRFLFQLILLILEKIGLTPPPPAPVTPVDPCATVTPSVAPSPEVTQTPTIEASQSASPSPSTSVVPSASNTQIPAQVLNLTNWKLTLPTGANGNPTEIIQTQLATYKNDPYFVVSNGAVRFRAPVNGVTTSGSSYPRTELREMSNNGTTLTLWNSFSGTHTMMLDQAITAVPTTKKHVVAGQIHDSEDDVIVVRLEDKKLFLEIGGLDGPILDANYTLGKRFTVKFEVKDNKTSIYYNNALTPVHTLAKSYSGAYFKAGAYTQSNCTTESSNLCSDNNYGEVLLYKVEITHQ